MLILKMLRNRNFIFLSGIVLGLVLGPRIRWMAGLTLPALGLVMTASASQIPLRSLRGWDGLVRPTLLAVAFSYALSASVTLALARWLVPGAELWAGFVLVAVAPPGVAILPFTSILAGDAALSLAGTAGAYVAALAIAPVLAGALVGPELLQPGRLVLILVELVLVPLGLSRLLRWTLPSVINRWRGTVVNWGLFIVILAVVAVNRDVFLHQPGVLLPVAVVALAITFGLGLATEAVLARVGVSRPARVSVGLFAAIKNSGFSAAMALALLGEQAAVPGAVVSAAIVLYLVWLSVRAGREVRAEG